MNANPTRPLIGGIMYNITLILGHLEQYRRAPVVDPLAIPSYKSLIRDVKGLSPSIDAAIYCVDIDPYVTAAHMFEDIRTRRLCVSTLHNEHPLFTPEENLKSRAVHDWYHYKALADFSLEGEYETYLWQCEACAPESRPALYTEVVLQAAHKVLYGEFMQQKVFIPYI